MFDSRPQCSSRIPGHQRIFRTFFLHFINLINENFLQVAIKMFTFLCFNHCWPLSLCPTKTEVSNQWIFVQATNQKKCGKIMNKIPQSASYSYKFQHSFLACFPNFPLTWTSDERTGGVSQAIWNHWMPIVVLFPEQCGHKPGSWSTSTS